MKKSISYNGKLTSGTPVKIDDSRNWWDGTTVYALSTYSYTDGTTMHGGGHPYIDFRDGYIYFYPTTNATESSLIAVIILYKER